MMCVSFPRVVGVDDCSPQGVFGRGEEDWLMTTRHGGLVGGPAHRVGRPAGDPRDVVTLQAAHHGRLPVDCGRRVALLAMVVVSPSKHLT